MTDKNTALTNIRGVGKKTAERIKSTLDIDGIEGLLHVSKEELEKVDRVGSKRAEKILTNVEEFYEECKNCGERKLEGKTCSNCLQILKEEIDEVENEVQEIKENISFQEKEHLERTLDQIRGSIEKEEPERGMDLLESLKTDLSQAEKLTGLVGEIEEKLNKESGSFYSSAYGKELEKIKTSFKNGDYNRGVKRAQKILNYIENEEEYLEMDDEEFLSENIVKFTRKIIGSGPRVGEKIYGSGLHTLKEVYKAGSERVRKKADIKESTTKILMGKLEDLIEKRSLDIEKRPDLEETAEEDADIEDKEESIFGEVEKEVETKSEPKKIQSLGEEEKKKRKKEKKTTSSEIYKRKQTEKVVNNTKVSHWLPVMVVTIVLIIAGYILFFGF